MMRIKMLAAISIAAVMIAAGASAAWAQVAGSKHDLSAVVGSQTTEVCVFCHTPHGSDSTVNAPLWNKTLPTTNYQRYSELQTATLDGQEVAVGSVSIACLSCHDGTQARDVVINAPGSGMAGNPVWTPGGIAAFTALQSPVPNLTGDLRDDHPISIAYAGGACIGATGDCTPASGGGDPDFNVATHGQINGVDNWWVNSTASTVIGREKQDIILYTRDFGGSVFGPSVECGSCHDPHDATARPVSFLRLSNAGSDVCLSCHVK